MKLLSFLRDILAERQRYHELRRAVTIAAIDSGIWSPGKPPSHEAVLLMPLFMRNKIKDAERMKPFRAGGMP